RNIAGANASTSLAFSTASGANPSTGSPLSWPRGTICSKSGTNIPGSGLLTARIRVAAQDFDGLRTAIMARQSTLPKRLVQVAGCALDHPDEIAFRTGASIAAAA